MNVVENNEKIFTKNMGKDIIDSKYNLLNKNNDFYEREGLFMRKTKDIVLDEVMEGLNWKERIIVRIFKGTFVKVYNISRINTFNKMLKWCMYH